MSSPVRFFNESSLAFPLKPKPAGDLFLKVMHALGKTEIKVNVIAKSDEALRDMKREYFGKDVYTDVISFLIEASPVLEGEIYCSPERIKKNAENYSESVGPGICPHPGTRSGASLRLQGLQ
ncbi:MAG: rRNA maturation RNAse YbeY [Candidatus Marinimicrobia bacterium]|nr:rRNA maturation RNAse YbeY [Candidatus Neomarinimicrobiota bacterium]